jgi:hypothetical protein
LTIFRSRGAEERYVFACFPLVEVCAMVWSDGQDPEDRVFIESMDWSTIKPDPSVGAVLCGFDAYVSEYIFVHA